VSGALSRPAVVLLAVLAALAVAGPASAHVGGGTAGSDFAGRVTAVDPAVPGVTVRVLQFGDDLEVDDATGTEVEVPGYSDEPYLRIGPSGVWRNARSPATYIDLDPYARTPLPAAADPAAAPQWERVSTAPRYVWHDHRTHWMTAGLLPPAVAADPTVGHTVLRWTVPMRYDGRPLTVHGVLTWSPPPPSGLVWPVYALLFLLPVAAGLLARGARPLAALLGAAAVAGLVHAVTTPAPPVTQGSRTGAVVSALLPALLIVLVAAVGLRAAVRGRGVPTGLAAVMAGWLLLVEGLPDVDALWSAHVLAAGPPVLARAAVAGMVAVGAGSVLGGIAAVRRFRDPHPAAVVPPDVPGAGTADGLGAGTVSRPRRPAG
jgi:hypothetical protein